MPYFKPNHGSRVILYPDCRCRNIIAFANLHAQSHFALQTCERSVAKSVIGAILRAILFQRAFGTIQPSTQQVCGVTLPCILSSELDSLVDAKVDEVFRTISHQSTSGSSSKTKTVIVAVEFCEEKIRRTWYSKTVE